MLGKKVLNTIIMRNMTKGWTGREKQAKASTWQLTRTKLGTMTVDRKHWDMETFLSSRVTESTRHTVGKKLVPTLPRCRSVFVRRE